MSETIPLFAPAAFVAGDTVKWRLKTVVYDEHKDPADGWVLTYELRNATGAFTITGTDNGDGTHLVTLTAEASAVYQAGLFHYQGVITKASVRHIVDRGTFTVRPDFEALSETDARTWAERVLDAIEAVLEGKASQDQLSYSIGDRSLTRMSWQELLEARQHFQREVRSQARAEAVREGRYHSGTIRTRL